MNRSDDVLAGLDLGSTAAKMVVMEHDRVVNTMVFPSHRWKELVAVVPDGARVFSTGYFKSSAEAEASCTEITAAKHGAGHLLGDFLPQVLVDIGGQDIKVIDIDRNQFILNDKCSAGTGAFLQFIALYLGLKVEELGELHSRAGGRSVEINSTCSVFALSEVISHLVDDVPLEEVVAGVHLAFASHVARMVPAGTQRLALFGGPSLNAGMVEALAEKLSLVNGEGLRVVQPPQFVNAVGAIIYGITR